MEGHNTYDPQQWTMRPELLGSMAVYIVLLAAVEFTPLCRAATLVLMAVLNFLTYDPCFTTVSFFLGALLADLYLVLEANEASRIPAAMNKGDWRLQILHSGWPFLLTLISLMCASYPSYYADRAAWSKFMWKVSISLFPNCKNPFCNNF